ncbi:MAG: winged helix-turn-helix domain-containing protein [Polyangiales bacterium]
MRRPVELTPWLKPRALRAWVDDAKTPLQHKRRLAVWMASLGRYAAHEIAELLLVTRDAVGRWLRAYNESGPDGFDGPGRGGRRHARLDPHAEERLVRKISTAAGEGRVLTGPQVQAMILEQTGEQWPLGTVYSLLHRHHWRKVQPRPRHVRSDPEAQRLYKKNSAASSRARSRGPEAAASASSSRTRAASA